MKLLFALILFSSAAYSSEYDNYNKTYDGYPSCVSWCKTKTLMKNCGYYTDREKAYFCEKSKREDYYFCEQQCRDEYRR